MIADLARDALPDRLSTEICIVGGGVNGQTLAGRLRARGHDVLIVESGDRDFRADVQRMAAGRNIGEDYYDLDTARLRLFGGTAAIWGGRCAELDPIDFKRRDWVAHSGWPFDKTELDPHYRDVFDQLGLSRPGEGRLWAPLGVAPPPFDPAKVDVDFWVFDEWGERFTDPARDVLGGADVLLNATITRIDVDDAGVVTGMGARALSGQTVELDARVFVLAAGALETVRLLMGAVPARPEGLGNDPSQSRDPLGRYFMEHPHARGGQILPEKMTRFLASMPRQMRRDGKRYAAYLRPSEDLQAEAGILNTSISLAARRAADADLPISRRVGDRLKHDLPSTRFWRSTYKRAKIAVSHVQSRSGPWLQAAKIKMSRQGMGLYAIVRAEQAPNPESRVLLGEETDAMGLRRVDLDWRLLPIDRDSVRVFMETLDAEYRRLGLATVAPEPWLYEEALWKTDATISTHPIGGYHHMGGTRMGTDPASSVVDADCRLHDSPNLYIAGASVFPTGGWANPTATTMALALRLGDHLRTVL